MVDRVRKGPELGQSPEILSVPLTLRQVAHRFSALRDALVKTSCAIRPSSLATSAKPFASSRPREQNPLTYTRRDSPLPCFSAVLVFEIEPCIVLAAPLHLSAFYRETACIRV